MAEWQDTIYPKEYYEKLKRNQRAVDVIRASVNPKHSIQFNYDTPITPPPATEGEKGDRNA